MIGLAALVGAAVVLLVASVVGARRPGTPVPDHDGYLDRWTALHQGYDPRASAWVRGWLTATAGLARPLAGRGVQPGALTLWSVWLAAAVVVAAAAGGRWPLLAGALVVASAVGDTLDGAVAALTDRATRWGYVADSLADRIADVAFLLALWLLGAPGVLAVACGVAFGLLEYLRARAGNAGMGTIGVVTVGERPVRVICCAGALAGAGLAVEHAAAAATAGVAVLAALSLAGLVQLAVVVRRRLAAGERRE